MRISTSTISGRTTYGRRHVLGITAGGGIATLLTGCVSLERGPAVPKSATLQASVLGLPNEQSRQFVVKRFRRVTRQPGIPGFPAFI